MSQTRTDLPHLPSLIALSWPSDSFAAGEKPAQTVTELPESVRQAFNLALFYKRYVDAGGRE